MQRQPRIRALIIGCGVLWICVSVGPWAAAQNYGQSAGTSALTFEPAALSFSQGAAASVKVTVALKSGKTGGTTLKATDLPSGLAVTFDPPSGEPTFTSTMGVRTRSTTTPGTYTVKVQATGNAPSSVASFTVTVEKSGGY